MQLQFITQRGLWFKKKNENVYSNLCLNTQYTHMQKLLTKFTKKIKKITFLFFCCISFITDSPVCAASSVTVVGASLDESISVPCRVNADPPDVEFEWSFSTSGERFEVPHGHYTTVQDISISGTDGSKSSSTLYDSGEIHGESDGKSAFIFSVLFSLHIFLLFSLCDFFCNFFIVRFNAIQLIDDIALNHGWFTWPQ